MTSSREWSASDALCHSQRAMTSDRILLWVLRATWAALPVTVGSLLDRALAERSTAIATTSAAIAWTVWVVELLATLVPHPISLTALRVIAPATTTAAMVATATRGDASALVVGLSAASVGLATVLAFLPSIGERMINGPAYPNERRMFLRVPGPLLLGPMPLAWALVWTGLLTGPLLLAGGRVIAGAAATALGIPLAALMARALHRLSLRWLVFVPAGVVLHDGVSVVDAVLFPRPIIEVLSPAPADTDSLDLTRGALGLALELRLREKVPMMLTGPAGRGAESGASARLIFTPTRPGEVLQEAAARRIPTG